MARFVLITTINPRPGSMSYACKLNQVTLKTIKKIDRVSQLFFAMYYSPVNLIKLPEFHSKVISLNSAHDMKNSIKIL